MVWLCDSNWIWYIAVLYMPAEYKEEVDTVINI
jgi:hypothetical protein